MGEQEGLGEFSDKKKLPMRVLYKCEECSRVDRYDPHIAGDRIACPDCWSGPWREHGQYKTDEEIVFMYPREGDAS